MTVNSETKEYIDSMISEQSIKISAFLSALCNVLEEKQVMTKEDFDVVLERSKIIINNVTAIGAENFLSFQNSIPDLEKLKEEILKKGLLKDRKWDDLK